MIPYLLAIAGGYLIAQSRKQDTFADGGTISIENRKDDLMIEQSKEISIFDEKRIGEEIILTLQKKYIKERNELFDKNVTSREITDFIKSRISVEYLIENGVLSPVYSYYSYAFQNTPTLGRPYKYQQAIKLAEQINNINRFDRPIPYYRVLIVPSVIVNSATSIPELGDYLLYTDNEISEEDLKKLGRYEDGGLLKYCWGGKMADGGMMADEDEMVYNYVKIKNYPTFQTEEEAKKFIKIGKPFLRKELKEGKIVLVHNGKEYYLADVKEKMADGGIMASGGDEFDKGGGIDKIPYGVYFSLEDYRKFKNGNVNIGDEIYMSLSPSYHTISKITSIDKIGKHYGIQTKEGANYQINWDLGEFLEYQNKRIKDGKAHNSWAFYKFIPKGGKVADGGYMSEGGELPLFYSIAYLQKSPKGKTDWRNWDDEDWDIYAIRHLVYNGIANVEKIGKDEYRVTNLDEDDDYEAVYTGWEIRQLAFDYDLPDSTDLEEEDAIFLSKGGKVENELYVAEFRKGEWTVKDKKNPKGNYTLSSKKENAENVRQFLIDNPSRLKYYRTNEYAKGGKMANGMMADEDEMVYNYVKIKNYPTFQTEEEAKKFIKIGKPFLRKELKEGKIVLVHNGKEYYLAYVKEKMADGAMMERGGKIQTLIMQQNDLDPQGYTLVDYDKEKKEWYWEDYKADTYSSGFKSRKDAYEDLNEYLFKDTEYRYEGKEGTMGQKWPDLPTPTKSHSFREY